MRSANQKLLFPILLAVITVCSAAQGGIPGKATVAPTRGPPLTTPPTPTKSPPIDDPVRFEVVAKPVGIEACQGSNCIKVSNEDIRAKADEYLQNDDDLAQESQLTGNVALSGVNATFAELQAADATLTQISAECSRRCPWPTYDDRDECCASCRYYYRVPRYIYIAKNEPCWVVSLPFDFRYQYVQHGRCREPNKVCKIDEPYCHPFYHSRCQQQWSVKRVVCLRFNFSFFNWSFYYTHFWYPSSCSCTRRGPLLPYNPIGPLAEENLAAKNNAG